MQDGIAKSVGIEYISRGSLDDRSRFAMLARPLFEFEFITEAAKNSIIITVQLWKCSKFVSPFWPDAEVYA